MADQEERIPEIEADLQRRISMSTHNFEDFIYISARLYTLTRNIQYRNIQRIGDLVDSLTRMFNDINDMMTETIIENKGQVEVLRHNI